MVDGAGLVQLAGGLGVLEPGTGIGRLEEYDIGISSSGADKVEAEAVVKALQGAGFRVTWYRLPECRLEDCRGVMQYQMSLGKPPCILLLLSDGYLRDSPFDNWYCAWELADAIRRLGQGERTEVQTLAMYKLKPGGALDSRRLDQLVVELMNHMAEYFAKAYRDVPTRDLRNFEHYNRLSLDFLAALEGGQCGKFSSTCGTLGYYLEVPKDLGLPGAFDPLIDAVRRALKASAGRGR